ncbi:MAG: chromate efflux transporter [Myxococcaceae bacterium]|nr:chromate efflux transporter [Myxococcaceae bacterium]
MHADATGRPVADLVKVFLVLGCRSFGGPVAHLGYFRAELVEKRRWLDDSQYADLVALCQSLPGPASSQLVFAVGMNRAGLIGALAASVSFTLPSAALMIAFAYGAGAAGGAIGAGWLQGLKVAAVAVVAQAVWAMGQKLCPDGPRVAICAAAAAALLAFPTGPAQLAVIAAGALAGAWAFRRPAAAGLGPERRPPRRTRAAAAAALALFVLLLVALPTLRALTPSRHVATFDGFYRAGAMVFGGGHVVLPLLSAEVVATGWLTNEQFLAGYAAAQALPGPLFTFAGYLGAAMAPGPLAWADGLWCLFAVFLPGWLLVAGALPFWERLRAKPGAQAALAGANASVVGVLLAALYHPVSTEGLRSMTDAVAAGVAFAMLEHARLPAWLVVLALALAGQWVLPH